MTNPRINVTEAMRQFAAGNHDVYTSLAYVGNALQMARHGIVQGISLEDVENLHAFATELSITAAFMRADMDTAEPRSDDPSESLDGTAPLDQHKR